MNKGLMIMIGYDKLAIVKTDPYLY